MRSVLLVSFAVRAAGGNKKKTTAKIRTVERFRIGLCRRSDMRFQEYAANQPALEGPFDVRLTATQRALRTIGRILPLERSESGTLRIVGQDKTHDPSVRNSRISERIALHLHPGADEKKAARYSSSLICKTIVAKKIRKVNRKNSYN